jgi:purine-nucleoside phosphorylase
VAERIEPQLIVPYSEIPHCNPATAPFHAGRLIFGRLAGQQVVCMQGRLHCYEGNTPAQTVFPLYVTHALGARRLIVTNAAGGINEGYRVGDIMLIADHINHTGTSPLTLDADTDVANLDFDMTYAYTPALRVLARRVAETGALSGSTLREGIYLALRGPSFETPAEIRAFRGWGADAVGMSTAHEVIAASALGMEVLGLSLITNMAAGIKDQPLTVSEVADAGRQHATVFSTYIEAILGALA